MLPVSSKHAILENIKDLQVKISAMFDIKTVIIMPYSLSDTFEILFDKLVFEEAAIKFKKEIPLSLMHFSWIKLPPVKMTFFPSLV